MKILSRALFLLFVLFGVLIAVSNSQMVELALWPLPHVIVMPVYLLVVGLLLLGVLAGLGVGTPPEDYVAPDEQPGANDDDGSSADIDLLVDGPEEAVAELTAAVGGE